MTIKVRLTNKENIESVVNEISNHIKWITQDGDQYTIIYEEHNNGKIKTIDKSVLNL